MKILVACDKFKGTATSLEVGHALASHLTQQHDVKVLGISDGGDGFLDVIHTVLKLKFIPWQTQYNGMTFSCLIGQDIKGCLYLESAQILGDIQLKNLPLGQRNSFVLGLVLKACLELNPPAIYLGLGGSLTSDGGMGALSAMGTQFYDNKGAHIPPSALALIQVHRFSLPQSINKPYPLLHLVADVENPPIGKAGGVKIYGSQKGGSAPELDHIELGMENWLKCLNQGNEKYCGAAGCLPTGLKALFHTRFHSGGQWVAQKLKLFQLLDWTDIVITGEGQYSPHHQGKLTGILLKSRPSILVSGQPLKSLIPETQCFAKYSLLSSQEKKIMDTENTIKGLQTISQKISKILSKI